MSRDSLHWKNTHDIASREYWTMIGCKGEIAQLHVLHLLTLIISSFICNSLNSYQIRSYVGLTIQLHSKVIVTYILT